LIVDEPVLPAQTGVMVFSGAALLAALGSRMPFWDRDIDVIVVPKADAKSLNGLMAVVDRYHIGQMVSVEVGENRAGREWLDMIAARQIEVIEAGSGIGIEDDIDLTLGEAAGCRSRQAQQRLESAHRDWDRHPVRMCLC
jgi:hypothetical protein